MSMDYTASSSDSNDGGPIFIVGPSRSGTAMVQSALNNHPDVHLAGETHYFDDLRPRLRDAALEGLDEMGQRLCEDYFLALAHRPYGHGGVAEKSSIQRDKLRSLAQAIGTGGDAYFAAFCRIQATSAGAVRWGEKTPRHVFRIDDLLERFPDARIICTIRDPRAMLASYRSWTHQGGFDFSADAGHEAAVERDIERARQSYNPVVHSLLLRSTASAIAAAQQRFGGTHVHVLRYETMVTEPEVSIRALANFVGVTFDAAMLEVPLHNSSFQVFNRHAGMSVESLERWRDTLPADEIAIAQRLCQSLLHSHGYPLMDVALTRREMVRAVAVVPAAGIRALRANRSRSGNLPGYLWRRMRGLIR